MIDVSKELETFFQLLEDNVAVALDPPQETGSEDVEFSDSRVSEPSLSLVLKRSRAARAEVRSPERPRVARTSRPREAKQRRIPKRYWTSALYGVALLLAGVAWISFSGQDSQAGSRIRMELAGLFGLGEANHSRLSVTSSPAQAHVYLDGQHIGVTPIVNIRVASGIHTLGIFRNGYVTIDSTLVVEGRVLANVRLTAVAVDVTSSDTSQALNPQEMRVAGMDSNSGQTALVSSSAAQPEVHVSTAYPSVASDSTYAESVRTASLAVRPVIPVSEYVAPDELRASGSLGNKETLAHSSSQETSSFEEADDLGDSLVAAGRYAEAIDAYEMALRIRPATRSIFRKIARAHKAKELQELPSTVFRDDVFVTE